MAATRTELSIDKPRVVRYFRYLMFLLGIPLVPITAFSLPLVLSSGDDNPAGVVVFLTLLGFLWLLFLFSIVWYLKWQAAELRYWIEDATVRINEGVAVRKRKSIPLDRLTDVELVQGPLMRIAGIWALNLQTAGSSGPRAEGVLYGIVDAEQVRDQIMAARDAAVAGSANRSDG